MKEVVTTMMDIFNIIRDVFQKQHGDLFDENGFESSGLKSPYMIQRWISMDNKANSVLMNNILNKNYTVFENDPEMLYKFLYTLVDKKRYSKIYYIKKKKEDKKVDSSMKAVEMLAQRNEISQREVLENIEALKQLNIDTKKYLKYKLD